MGLQFEIEKGIIKTIANTVRAEIHLDMLSLAELALSENNINVAAVLASASLETHAKQLAADHGNKTEDIELSDCIHFLKSKGVLGGPQGKVANSFVTLRNKAMHAEWDKIDRAEIAAVIAFIKEWV